MKVSLEWLNTFVDLAGLSPEAIAEALTRSGLEVESIESTGGAFSGVLVGKVAAVDPHPNADRLRLVTVDLGSKGQQQVVCGASNVAMGMRIAFAPTGAKLVNRKDGSVFELAPATLRGVVSAGMVCALDELGLQAAYESPEGIWPLDSLTSDAQLGVDLREALGISSDTVLDVTPNANRGDLMSIIGVAREVSALFGRPLKVPEAAMAGGHKGLPYEASPYSVKLSDPSVCSFYAGALLGNITVSQSPDWMVQRLTASGVRSINTIVDITNYIMLEWGQPLHAFDVSKLGASGTINVRYAKPGEHLMTLDAVDRPLAPQSVVVTFEDRPVALAGVMGGEDTGITDTTQSVLLECAYFPSATTRKSSRSVGVHSESSNRFERGVDAQTCQAAFSRAIELMISVGGANLQGVSSDDHRQAQPLSVPFSLARMERILGLSIPASETETILGRLGFTLSPGPDKASYIVSVPSFRQHDVSREIDVIEEVIRIYGYDEVPYTLPQGSSTALRTLRASLLNTLRKSLVGSGLRETYTLSLIGEDLLHRVGYSQDTASTVQVTNSHSQDHTLLRQSLLPTLLEVAKDNQDKGNETFWAFELGKTYRKQKAAAEKDSGVTESLYLSGVLMGHPGQGTWHQSSETDFYTLKGVLENLFGRLGLSQTLVWEPERQHALLHPGQAAKLSLGKSALGICGRLHPVQQDTLKYKTPVFLFELDVEVLAAYLSAHATSAVLSSIPAFPAVHRDIAFSAPVSLSHQDIVQALSHQQFPLLTGVSLFDEYRGGQLAEGTRSLAYHLTIQSPSGTLTDGEIDSTMGAIREHLGKKLPVTFR